MKLLVFCPRYRETCQNIVSIIITLRLLYCYLWDVHKGSIVFAHTFIITQNNPCEQFVQNVNKCIRKKTSLNTGNEFQLHTKFVQTINKLHGDSVNLDAAFGQFTPAFTPVVQFRSMEGGLQFPTKQMMLDQNVLDRLCD